jgi:hypothetical protein
MSAFKIIFHISASSLVHSSKLSLLALNIFQIMLFSILRSIIFHVLNNMQNIPAKQRCINGMNIILRASADISWIK